MMMRKRIGEARRRVLVFREDFLSKRNLKPL
jgi:hypothetical protein